MAPPKPLTVTDDGHWKPLIEGEQQIKVVSEYAKSSRARCRLCSEKILKNEVRLGFPVKWRGGEYGWISSWRHLLCSRLEAEDHDKNINDIVWERSLQREEHRNT
eukprot:GSMAST32.ASY1.ANO1.1756.1 assembled CDS